MSGLKCRESLKNIGIFQMVNDKHIVLQQPKSSGSHYRNYKGIDSITLLTMVGPEYEFLFVDVGINAETPMGETGLRAVSRMVLRKIH